jgi:HIRAN domain
MFVFTKVVGLSFIEFTDPFDEEQPVKLRHEPNNPFDSGAVAVIINDKNIGYLPRTFEHRAKAAKIGEGFVLKTSRWDASLNLDPLWANVKDNQVTQIVIAIRIDLEE